MDGMYPVKGVRDLTTGYDSRRADGKAQLPTSSSTQMITFYFENGLEATLRTSGTEPKIKFYIMLRNAAEGGAAGLPAARRASEAKAAAIAVDIRKAIGD